jgi:tripartite-type tricarboxylate transporter receptor subunit TctC
VRGILRLAGFLCLFALAGLAGAQQYPSKPVTLIVAFAAASDADNSARNLAQHARGHLGEQSIVVSNRPGASGAIGTLAAHNAPADGYTLLLARIATHAILPATDKATPYKWSDFTMLSVLELNPLVCAVKSDAPYRSLADLLGEARRNPGKLSFATVGSGTIQNLGPQYLFSLAGLPTDAAIGVPYKGSGDLTTALLGGQVEFACNNFGTLLPHIQAGALRGLMTTTANRLPEATDIPTARELNWPDMEQLSAWSALMGPPGLPKTVIDRWTEVLARLNRDSGWIEGTRRIGGIPSIRSPEETEKFVRAQYALYEKLAARLDLKQ